MGSGVRAAAIYVAWSGLRRAGIGPESGSAEIDSFLLLFWARRTPFFAPKLACSIGSFAKKKSFFSRIDTPILEHFLRPNVGHSYGEYGLVLIVEE